MQRYKIVIIISVIVVLLVGYFVFVNKEKAPIVNTYPSIFVINDSDKINSWNFVGAYSDNLELQNKSRKEIEELLLKLNDEKQNKFNLNIEIANRYHFLGDGEKEFYYLSKALEIDSTNTGLPYHNMGNLMDKIGAYNSAKDAYRKSFDIQPLDFYIDTYIEFMKQRFPQELEEEVLKAKKEVEESKTKI